ncbi:peptide chain release factor N(5)-glutamine methyltransferase [Leptotrichia sp. oral taxon 417]|uniref:peptide chain release factor N(5)-glutamine methyltransferase n=1 Tax=Leptotrichia sp. oral taxon 417 TaxID=712365 RepID=UPI0015C0522D|nr:peptide chain release factor N(5)-glutamine methyltransferase [Leptotrichia sp. oral taxon 417]NWO27656.1 peptide chain release factor N(5)-glutamine methyltransferase [Leptotrichia sp. oral taxon 417]
MNNLLDILNKSVNYLEKKNIKNARLTAESIIAEIMKMERIMLYAEFERVLSENELKKIREKLNEIVNKSKEKKKSDNNDFENTVKSEKQLKLLLDKSVQYLEKNDIQEGKLIAEIVFSHVLNIDRMMLFTKYRDDVEDEEIEKIRYFIQKIGREKFPVQYLLNEQEFYGRKFYVDKGVLIPRQDTEILVEKMIDTLKDKVLKNEIHLKILDIGVGSGIIGITAALEIESSYVLGVDISDKALETAQKNKEILKVSNIKFLKSDLFENVEFREFDMIVSNPPYISLNEVGIMSDDTLLHEPSEALFAENDGLYFYYEICQKASDYLADFGYLLFEIGYKQGKNVAKIMASSGFKNIEVVKDLAGLDRVVIGQKIINKIEN